MKVSWLRVGVVQIFPISLDDPSVTPYIRGRDKVGIHPMNIVLIDHLLSVKGYHSAFD